MSSPVKPSNMPLIRHCDIVFNVRSLYVVLKRNREIVVEGGFLLTVGMLFEASLQLVFLNSRRGGFVARARL